MSTVPVTPAKISWLKRVGHFLGKVLAVIAQDAKPVVDDAALVAKAIMPQFSGLIDSADAIADKIIAEAIAAEGMEQAGAAATGGPAKLQAVLAASGPAIDNWIASRFPGADKVSEAVKAGLISALVNLVNDVTVAPQVAAPPAAAPKS